MAEDCWDPFEGKAARERDRFHAFAVGKWQRKHKIAGALGVAGLLLWIALPLIGLTVVNWLGFATAMATGFYIALTLDTEFPDGDAVKQTINPLQKVAAHLAEQQDWGLSLIQPSTPLNLPGRPPRGGFPPKQLEKLARDAMRKKGRDHLLSQRQLADLARLDLYRTFDKRPVFLLVDRRIYPLTQDFKTMVMPGAVAAAPVHVQAVFRWEHKGVPLWAGIGGIKGDVRHPKMEGGRDSRPDAHTFFAIYAFPLGRDTGLNVSLRAAFPYIEEGDAQLDDRTFNRIYAVTLEKGDEQALFQTFTPAAQSTLLDLFADYGAEVAVLDDLAMVRVISTALMSEENDKLEGAAQEWNDKLTAIADDIVRLKRYLE